MYLGEKDEWKKMTTARGDICILCFNKAKEVDGPRIKADIDEFLKDREGSNTYPERVGICNAEFNYYLRCVVNNTPLAPQGRSGVLA